MKHKYKMEQSNSDFKISKSSSVITDNSATVFGTDNVNGNEAIRELDQDTDASRQRVHVSKMQHHGARYKCKHTTGFNSSKQFLRKAINISLGRKKHSQETHTQRTACPQLDAKCKNKQKQCTGRAKKK